VDRKPPFRAVGLYAICKVASWAVAERRMAVFYSGEVSAVFYSGEVSRVRRSEANDGVVLARVSCASEGRRVLSGVSRAERRKAEASGGNRVPLWPLGEARGFPSCGHPGPIAFVWQQVMRYATPVGAREPGCAYSAI
jgi:hypothetical protein